MRRFEKKFATGAAMASFAAGLFSAALRKKRRGRLLAALPGGRTPARLFGELARLPVLWDRVVFFMTDERVVPVSSPASNFGAARRAFFSKINIRAENLHPVKAGAAAYEKELLKETGPSGSLDLAFLGLGEDGHTASLFSGSTVFEERAGFVCGVKAPSPAKPANRVTLTLKTLNRARILVLMASGPAKKRAYEKAAGGDRHVPAGRLRPRGDLYLLYSEKD